MNITHLLISEWKVAFWIRVRSFEESQENNLSFFCRKLQQYSPNDTSKAFDRQVTRRANVKFNPKQAIEILRLGEPSSTLDDEQKLDLVKKYMEVSNLVNVSLSQITLKTVKLSLNNSGATNELFWPLHLYINVLLVIFLTFRVLLKIFRQSKVLSVKLKTVVTWELWYSDEKNLWQGDIR